MSMTNNTIAAPVSSTIRTAMATASPRTAESPSILLVDDDELSLGQLRQIIEVNGLRCVAVPTGIDALIYCDRHRPHVVVTDLSMPELRGDVLARWVKARYPRVPIVVVTGQDMTDPAVLALLGIVVDVLPKPVDLERLVGLLLALARPADRREVAAGLT